MEFLTVLNAAAASATVIAAILIASNYSPRAMIIGFSTFTVASVLWILSGYLDAKPSLVTQNAVLLIVNLFGIWRWLPRAA